jgi:hypothetical protein
VPPLSVRRSGHCCLMLRRCHLAVVGGVGDGVQEGTPVITWVRLASERPLVCAHANGLGAAYKKWLCVSVSISYPLLLSEGYHL